MFLHFMEINVKYFIRVAIGCSFPQRGLRYFLMASIENAEKSRETFPTLFFIALPLKAQRFQSLSIIPDAFIIPFRPSKNIDRKKLLTVPSLANDNLSIFAMFNGLHCNQNPYHHAATMLVLRISKCRWRVFLEIIFPFLNRII